MTWQELINEVYGYWKENDIEYGELLEYTRGRYGELAELAILIKNYNYQVENGGHLQYLDNGYCDGKIGAFSDKDKTIPLHHRMIELFEKFNLHTTEEGKPVYEVMQAFANKLEIIEAYEEEYEEEWDCPYCDGSGYADEEEYELCGNCNGAGEFYETVYEFYESEVYIPDYLDDDYYAVNQKFIAFFEEFVYAIMLKSDSKGSLDK